MTSTTLTTPTNLNENTRRVLATFAAGHRNSINGPLARLARALDQLLTALECGQPLYDDQRATLCGFIAAECGSIALAAEDALRILDQQLGTSNKPSFP